MVSMQINRSIVQSFFDMIFVLAVAIGLAFRSIYVALWPKKEKDIAGEIALVTGGGNGLGRLIALRLAKLGAIVVLWDVNYKGVEETVEMIKGLGGKAHGYKCDLSDKEDVYKVADQVRSEIGDVTILVNNAGVLSGHLLLKTPDHLIKRTFDVNVVAHFWTVKAFLPKMIEKDHGHIVTIASMAGHCGISKLVDYCSSKYAAVGFDEALSVELEDEGIFGVKTTCIKPYFIRSTGMFDNVNSRWLPTLKPNDVADRVVEAMRKNERSVPIPGTMSILIFFKTFMPWDTVSYFLRRLVPDAVPHHVDNNNKQNDNKVNNVLSDNSKQTISMQEKVSTLNHRIPITTVGKDL